MREADRVLNEAVEAGQVPGVVAIAATPDAIIYEGAFGLRRLGGGDRMNMETVFRIASMTKAITAAAAMQLVEEGKLALDQAAGEIMPDLASPRVLEGFTENGTPRLRPARGTITIRHLLTHISGFGHDIWNAELQRYYREARLPPTRTGMLAGLQAPLTFDPGTRWQYGISLDWLGRILEAVAGENLERLFRHRLFEPLGMADSGYLVRPDMEPRLATMHVRGAAGLEPVDMPSEPPREFFPGGGGLHATARDYMQFLRMLLGGGALDGRRVLKEETVRTMLRDHLPDGIVVEPLVSAVLSWSRDVDLLPGIAKGWGLSFLINREPIPERRSAGSGAWAGLNNTYYWLDPSKKIAGAIFTQILPFADPAVLDLFGKFERAVYRMAA